ncbi:MFS general substrate transporter [Zopfia rhizophila CBS 207.26]|uniref:MFS general substrate transporter n=1 Tax=Zopfia rhizophila CBS 207.26 TaxID=1314779 RepID=A0A6A6E6R5_9PEZI|nr:MFS general substrate transporter [Zopfia rhizophila CBS 207.26]
MSNMELQSFPEPIPPDGAITESIDAPRISRSRALFIIISVTGITFLNTIGQGLLLAAIPRIAIDLNIPETLIQWPTAMFSLTLGCTLLIAGAVADAIGNRPVFLIGCAFHLAFMVGCALIKTGAQLLAFRAFQGVALSLCMPASVGIITTTFPSGMTRNIAFACFSGGNPIGYGLGLLLGGIFVDTLGWRWCYYLGLCLNGLILITSFFSIPLAQPSGGISWSRLRSSVDWVGAIIASVVLALLSYVLAVISSSSSNIRNPINIIILCLAIILIPCFIFWVGRQEARQSPAIIPNSLWRKIEFSSVCAATFLTWAMFNSFGFFVTLTLQKIQHVSAFQTSLRFLPLMIMSILANVVAGYLVGKVPAGILATATSLLSAAAPLLFATMSPRWSYWLAAFPAMAVSPISSDFLFNISNLVITAAFPSGEQAVAGGVFSTVSQLGNSIGLALTAVIASSVMSTERHGAVEEDENILRGYKGAFWASFGAAIGTCLISAWGLRKVGKVGLKRE